MNNASVRLLVIVGVLTLALAALLRPGTARQSDLDESTAAATRTCSAQIDRLPQATPGAGSG